tara:strand:- start:965 stop:2059 length:1095 start_codon:yes stop_codon:yes gene_type:complete
MKLFKIIEILETWAPLNYQEEYDNSGLLIGDVNSDIKKILISLDCTNEVINEAINLNCNLIISHHPLIFKGIKSITGKNYVEKNIIKAIKSDISIYSIHTNLDNILDGVNNEIAEKLNITNRKILNLSSDNSLFKLITYVPNDFHEIILNSLFKSGAGKIGKYSECSFTSQGEGSFRGSILSNPRYGKKNIRSNIKEKKIEVIFEKNKKSKIIDSLKLNHPYEEVAYDIFKLENKNNLIGSGLIGDIKPMKEIEFLKKIKKKFNLKFLKHTKLKNKLIKKVAVCGGSGSFLIKNSIHSNADIFITSDIKYHDFFESNDRIILVDIGHYESEQFTKNIIFSYLIKKISKFDIVLSKINTNPVKYF